MLRVKKSIWARTPAMFAVKTMTQYSLLLHFATLRIQLVSLEADLGLDQRSPDEINLICALAQMSPTEATPCSSRDLRDHHLCRRMSRPTFFRAVASLIEAGWVSKAGSVRSGLYTLNPELLRRS